MDVPYLVVVADRKGADITVAGRGDAVATRHVDGDDRVHKAKPGGWSQRRYHQRVENTWEFNARVAADSITRAADAVNAEVVILAGDVRAIEVLEKHLPARHLRRVEEINNGSRNDRDTTHVDDAAQRWIASVSARYTTTLLQKFEEERGQRDRAADGVDATFDALNMSNVTALLVHDDWRDTRRGWFADAATPVAKDRRTIEELGLEARSARLADVAIRAALGTGAGVWIVPRSGGPTDGLGAILRWS
jgi:peptide subunit release factor 1 (eRF1)